MPRTIHDAPTTRARRLSPRSEHPTRSKIRCMNKIRQLRETVYIYRNSQFPQNEPCFALSLLAIGCPQNFDTALCEQKTTYF